MAVWAIASYLAMTTLTRDLGGIKQFKDSGIGYRGYGVVMAGQRPSVRGTKQLPVQACDFVGRAIASTLAMTVPMRDVRCFRHWWKTGFAYLTIVRCLPV
jgi:hypothetical protein